MDEQIFRTWNKGTGHMNTDFATDIYIYIYIYIYNLFAVRTSVPLTPHCNSLAQNKTDISTFQ